jgi:hypothetical protein
MADGRGESANLIAFYSCWQLYMIDEDVAEQLDVIPLRFRVRVIRHPRYGCRACAEVVVQAPAPERPITGSMATEALIAQHLFKSRKTPVAAASFQDLKNAGHNCVFWVLTHSANPPEMMQ